MKSGSSLISDFWWLPENVSFDDLVVGVGHHKEIADNEEVPPLESWYRSLTPEGHLSNEVKYYSITSINEWRNACKNTNIYRTLKIFKHNTGEAIFLGPFLLDIDNEEDLDDAQSVARQVVEYLITQLKLSLNDLRIFFSGHKGFNVEIRPQALGIHGSVLEQIKLSHENLEKIIQAVKVSNTTSTVIDPVYGGRREYRLKHPYIRLHDSINKWICGDTKVIARKKHEITYKQLREKHAAEISSESEIKPQSS